MREPQTSTLENFVLGLICAIAFVGLWIGAWLG